MGKTRIIAIEGIDGSGKSVQFKTLRDTLIKRGYTVDSREFPVYSSYFGSLVGSYLSGADGVRADEVDGKSMALWYALDRWENLKDYKDGVADYMLINRYVLSNAVYQSIREVDIGRADLVDWVFDLEYGHFGIPQADLFLFYDVAPQQAGENVMKKGFREYVGGNKKDVYEESKTIQQRAREKYVEAAETRQDVELIQCMGENGLRTIEDIAAETIMLLESKGLV